MQNHKGDFPPFFFFFHLHVNKKAVDGIMVNNHGLLHAILLSSLRTSYENLSLNHVTPGNLDTKNQTKQTE